MWQKNETEEFDWSRANTYIGIDNRNWWRHQIAKRACHRRKTHLKKKAIAPNGIRARSTSKPTNDCTGLIQKRLDLEDKKRKQPRRQILPWAKTRRTCTAEGKNEENWKEINNKQRCMSIHQTSWSHWHGALARTNKWFHQPKKKSNEKETERRRLPK